MIGANAVAGGLIGLAVASLATLLGFTGIAAGVVVVRRRRNAAGVVAIAAGATVIAWCAVALWKALIPTQGSITIRAEQSNSKPLASSSHRCTAILDSLNCFASSDATHLTLVFPDGRQDTVVAHSLYAETKGNSLRKIAYLSPPGSTVLDLLDVIDAEVARGPSGDAAGWAKVREQLANSTARQGDQFLLFSYKAYDIKLWVLPREPNSDRIAYWYEVYPQGSA